MFLYMLGQRQLIIYCHENRLYTNDWAWGIIREVVYGYREFLSACLFSNDDSDLEDFPGESMCALEGMEITISRKEWLELQQGGVEQGHPRSPSLLRLVLEKESALSLAPVPARSPVDEYANVAGTMLSSRPGKRKRDQEQDRQDISGLPSGMFVRDAVLECPFKCATGTTARVGSEMRFLWCLPSHLQFWPRSSGMPLCTCCLEI